MNQENSSEDAEEEDAESAVKVGDHIATVYTQMPRGIDEQMQGLATQLLSLESKIHCSNEPGLSSRLQF